MSKIEWTGITWNPTTGCNKVSAGCKYCYAEVMSRRLQAMGQQKYANGFELTVHEGTLIDPLFWKKPSVVFVNSMSDLFHGDVPFGFIDKVLAVIATTPRHTYQVLTKRPERMAEYFSAGKEALVERWALATYNVGITNDDDDDDAAYNYVHNQTDAEWPLNNLWLGTSTEDQEQADKRIPHLLKVPARVRFLSCEPLLGNLNLSEWLSSSNKERAEQHSLRTGHETAWLGKGWSHCKDCDNTLPLGGIDWVIAGGESGHKARPMHPDWARSLRDQCVNAGVPFFFKQWGNHGYYGHGNYPDNHLDLDSRFKDCSATCNSKKTAGRMLDGREWNEMPLTQNVAAT